jgi:hypothetical protein
MELRYSGKPKSSLRTDGIDQEYLVAGVFNILFREADIAAQQPLPKLCRVCPLNAM